VCLKPKSQPNPGLDQHMNLHFVMSGSNENSPECESSNSTQAIIPPGSPLLSPLPNAYDNWAEVTSEVDKLDFDQPAGSTASDSAFIEYRKPESPNFNFDASFLTPLQSKKYGRDSLSLTDQENKAYSEAHKRVWKLLDQGRAKKDSLLSDLGLKITDQNPAHELRDNTKLESTVLESDPSFQTTHHRWYTLEDER
jgi:hypothetical protein